MDNLDLQTVFARNCEVRRIDRPSSSSFLDRYHRMGSASCRYSYGLFVRRRTGASEAVLPDGELVAVATFSSLRRWHKENGVVISCEWIRYASLPDIRVVGGMGKLLSAFVRDVRPDDVMTYADPGWSDGNTYRRLGFKEEGEVVKPGFRCMKFRFRTGLRGI